MGFNGNDALAIYPSSGVSGTTINESAVEIDIFGRIGNDPGSAWTGDGGYTTVDKTLVRKSSVTGGITVNPTGTGPTAFTTLTTEWDLYDIDVATYLGSHTFSGGSSSTFVSGFEDLDVGNVTSYELSGLDPNTTYFYVVRATNAYGTSANSNEIEVTTNKAAETVSGTVSFSSLENVGEGTAVSVTSGKLTFDEEAHIESLSVEAGAQIDVNSGIGLIINGDLRLKSPANNGAAASFKDEGATLVGGNYIIERHIDAYTSAEDGWHLLASPFNENLTINGSDFDPVANDDDFYGWDEPSYTWLNHQQGIPANFEVGKGYLVAYKTAASMRDFTANSDDFSHVTADVVLLDNASRTNNQGWHLVGNSFLSAVVWDTDNEDWLADNIEVSAQVLDVNQSGNYLAIDKGETIQALQGFFVRVTVDGGNSLILPESARTHSAGDFMKSTSSNTLELKVSNDKNSYFDKTKIKIQEGASQAYDPLFDGSKLKGFTSAPQLFTVSSDNKELAINVISNQENEVQIPMHFEARFEANYMITVENNTLQESVSVFLTDLVLNQEINLNTTSSYSFTAYEGDNPNRFLIHFGALSLDESSTQTATHAYVYNSSLYVLNASGQTQVDIIDLQGRTLQNNSFRAEGLYSQPISLPTGVYVVRVMDEKGVRTAKVVVE